MHEIALRYIFEKETVTKTDCLVLEEGIAGWVKKIDLTASDKWELRRIMNALIADENGHFNRAKEILKQNNWHYRKLYKVGLPYITNPDKCRTFGKL
jgi:hypothetical protein